MTDLEIRPATPADVPLVLSFVRLLAEHEGHASAVTASEADLRHSLFGEGASTECLLAYDGGEPVGCAIFCPKFSSYPGRCQLYLEDLVVTPAARGRGVGRRLLGHLARLARERGAARLEWFVDRENRTAEAFYRRLGAVVVENVTVMRLSGDALDELADA